MKLIIASTIAAGLMMAISVHANASGAGNIQPSSAQAPIEQVLLPNIGKVDYQHLFSETSMNGESMDQFAARISGKFREFSDATGYEACGVIAENEMGQFSVVVGTNFSHVACANFSSKVMAGYKPTLITIHSHGGEKTFAASKTDQALLGKDAFGPRSRTSLRVTGQKLSEFSKTDFSGGFGYLATPEGAIYQEGSKNIRTVR